MPYEGDIPGILDTHDSDKFPVFLVSIEHNTVINLMTEFLSGHIWLLPSVAGYDPLICHGRVINNGVYLLKIRLLAFTYHVVSLLRNIYSALLEIKALKLLMLKPYVD